MSKDKGNTSKRPGRKTELNEEVLHKKISKKAYELHEQRGWGHGKDIDDWLEAEKIIKAEMKKIKKTEVRIQNK